MIVDRIELIDLNARSTFGVHRRIVPSRHEAAESWQTSHFHPSVSLSQQWGQASFALYVPSR
jgi:hypothetical protein